MIRILILTHDNKLIAGISGKSQLMFAITYTTRYLDLFTNYISMYNSSMKVSWL